MPVLFDPVPPPLSAWANVSENLANVTCEPDGSYSTSVQLMGNGGGGMPPYIFTWNFGDGSVNSSLQDPYHVYTSLPQVAILTVTDQSGSKSTASVNVPAAQSGCPLGVTIESWPFELLISAALAVGIVIVTLIYVARRGKRKGNEGSTSRG